MEEHLGNEDDDGNYLLFGGGEGVSIDFRVHLNLVVDDVLRCFVLLCHFIVMLICLNNYNAG